MRTKGFGLRWKSVLTGFALLLPTTAAIASEPPLNRQLSSATSVRPVVTQLAQVTTIRELSDVQLDDWAYVALQRLIEEYGCMNGDTNRMFRGNRAVTRFEFAAGLQHCIDVITQLLGNTGLSTDAILLLEEFSDELAVIERRTVSLENDVATLEANQFSTTTKLRGQLDTHLVLPLDEADGIANEADATFDYRARLNLDTSFTGEDRLRLRLQASDSAEAIVAVAGGLADGTTAGSGAMGSRRDSVVLDDIYYSFPVGDRLNVELAANSRANSDFVSSVIVPYAGPAVAEFGEDGFYESGFDQGGSLGLGLNYALTDNLILDLAYSTESANQNISGSGLFNNYEYLAQLNYLSDGLFDAALTYQDGEVQNSTIEYVLAGSVNFDFGQFELGGYYAFIEDESGDADEWQVGALLPDFLTSGNSLGLYGGVASSPNSNPVVVEGFYSIGVNEFITITPSVIYGDLGTGIGDDSAVYGVVRTTFSF